MNNNIYISTTFIKNDSTLKDALLLLKDNGINFAELGSNHCYEGDYSYLNEYKINYLIHNYFPIPKKSFVLNIASLNDEIRKRSIVHVKTAIDFCKSISSLLYTFHPGFLSDPDFSSNCNANYDFVWKKDSIHIENYNKCKELMYDSLDGIIKYASSSKVKIAIETEGSFHKKDRLLMQRPEEYQEFMIKYSSSDIGINLNIGHLNLAANAFHFEWTDFVDLIQDYIVAMELSHNDGLEDQHLPLQRDGWYWDLINDRRFKDTFKILEFRNTPISEIVNNIKLIQEKEYAFSVS
jgi:sugar phosphate isomerase/epimerase